MPVALLIEDDRVAARVVADWLGEAGWSVVHVENGHDGVHRFAELRPAAVVADVVLPGLDGTAVCAHIRMSPYGDRVPIVLISARTHAREAALAAGADAFLSKPVRKEELLAALSPRPPIERGDPPGDAMNLRPGVVRVPRAGVLGPGDCTLPKEEGALCPGAFLPLLERLHRARFSGVLEAFGADGLRAKLVFADGAPVAARSNDEATGFGRVVSRLGILSAEHLAASVEEGRRNGIPLGEVLVRSQLMDRRAVERALREQVLQRAVGIGLVTDGQYVLDHAEPIGLAGFDVHPAAIAWRLHKADTRNGQSGATPPSAVGQSVAAPGAAAPSAAPGAVPSAATPSVPAEDTFAGVRDHYVRIEPAVVGLWPLLDPDDTLGVSRALLTGGATLGDCLRIGNADLGALIALLCAWGLCRLTVDAPDLAQREAGLAELNAGALAEALRGAHQALLDANHYTVLGLHPDADADEVSAATVAALARYQPEGLPAALDAASRVRARAVYERALEAGRVLGDAARRAIYDARLGGEAQVRQGDIGMEDHAVLQADRARELFRRGEYVTAAALFHMAILLEGEAADILAMLGWARHCACPDDPAAGEAELRRALLLGPSEEYALYYLGCLLAERSETEEARRLLRAAVEQNHEFEAAREALRELEP